MKLLDYIIVVILSAVMVAGGIQMYRNWSNHDCEPVEIAIHGCKSIAIPGEPEIALGPDMKVTVPCHAK